MQQDTHPASTIRIGKGNLYLKAALYEKYFPGIESVILMKRGQAINILPIMNANSGGLLLKIRNAEGDRVLHAQEFFRDHGIDERMETVLSVAWDPESIFLRIDLPPSACREIQGAQSEQVESSGRYLTQEAGGAPTIFPHEF